MGNFVNTFKSMSDISTTENGAICYRTTRDSMLDFFGNVGGMRNSSDNDIISSWLAARQENSELADNAILYSRGIRNGGLGERRISRLLLKELAKIDPDKVIRNFSKIVDTGRWDDLFVLFDTPCEFAMTDFVKRQLIEDSVNMGKNAPVSLCVKWCPSINTSSKETKRLGRRLCSCFGWTEKYYRKKLSSLRSYIDIVESKMSRGDWDSINFESVPSVAMSRYVNTFNKHVPERFAKYKEDLSCGKAKVNATTLYPYDIVQKYFKNKIIDAVDMAQWEALPNYLENNEDDVLFVIDVSGSMTEPDYKPISTSVGLGLYFAQRNKGAFHNAFMTFSEHPKICRIEDKWNLRRNLDYICNSDWGFSTNLDEAFSLIYKIARKTNDVPKAICVVSDMQINDFSSEDEWDSIISKWSKKFRAIELNTPKVIFWNVNGSNTFLGRPSDKVSFVSGYGIGSFKNLTTLIEKSAYEAMVEILTKPEFCWN